MTIYDVARPNEARWSLRRVPGLIGDAVRLVWAAGRRELLVSIGIKAVNGVGLGVVLLAGRDVLGAVLAAEGAGRSLAGVLPELAALSAVVALIGFLGAVGREYSDVLGELAARHAQRRIIAVAAAMELEAYETPAFHDRLQRASMGGRMRPLQMVHGLLGLLGAALGVAGVAAAIFALEPLMAPFVLAAAVPLWAAAAKGGQVMFEFSCKMTPAERERAYLYQLLTHKEPAAEVRAFGLAGFLGRRHERLYDLHVAELRRTARRRLRLSLLGSVGTAAILGGSIATLVALALADRMTLAEAGTAAGAVLLLGERLISAAYSAGSLHEAAPFIDDFNSFVALQPEAERRRPDRPAPAAFQRLVVDDVSFTYPSADRPALRGVSMEIRRGEIVALVGENGSGKTTLAKLLCRLYSPQTGRICWDGVDSAAVDPDELRRCVAVIFQDFLRYTLPARDNIGMGRHQRIDDLAGIVASAAQAGADDFLAALPEGYETLLGPEFEGGQDLSIGQWQRVALARAFFRDAPFIILDEPTAALDARAEHELFASIRSVCRGRSVLLISHRFSSVRSADRIYVLRDGEVVEHGTHEALIAEDGLYAELFALQASSYRDAAEERGRQA